MAFVQNFCQLSLDYNHTKRVNAESTTLDGTLVKILGYDDLIKNKLATNRPRDLNDVAELHARTAKKNT